MLNRKDVKDFLDFALKRIQSSAWTTEEASKELCDWLDLEKEQATWREQSKETDSAISGKFYL